VEIFTAPTKLRVATRALTNNFVEVRDPIKLKVAVLEVEVFFTTDPTKLKVAACRLVTRELRAPIKLRAPDNTFLGIRGRAPIKLRVAVKLLRKSVPEVAPAPPTHRARGEKYPPCG
jgi:hypothetical protein